MNIEYKSFHCRRILDKPKKATQFPCSYVISPYLGCDYGCIYCDECVEKDPTGNLPKQIRIKVNAPSLLRKELKNAQKGVVCIYGYQPAEKEYRITRKILELMSARKFPVHIVTKSDIVLDDLNLLLRIADKGFCAVSFIINTLDEDISNIFEPSAPSPNMRLEALGKVTEAGILSGLAIMPIIPYITDSDKQLENIVSKAADIKAGYVVTAPLKMEDNCRARMIDLIKRHFPELLIKYRKLYEFGAAPDVLYSKKLRGRIGYLLKKYRIAEGMQTYLKDYPKEQVNIEDFL